MCEKPRLRILKHFSFEKFQSDEHDRLIVSSCLKPNIVPHHDEENNLRCVGAPLASLSETVSAHIQLMTMAFTRVPSLKAIVGADSMPGVQEAPSQ